MHSIEGVLRMTDEINAQFGFERAFGKTNDNADADTKITKFGISFNSDGTTTFFAQLENHQPVRKNILKSFRKRKLLRRKRQRKGTVKTNRSKKNYGSGKFKRRTFG